MDSFVHKCVFIDLECIPFDSCESKGKRCIKINTRLPLLLSNTDYFPYSGLGRLWIAPPPAFAVQTQILKLHRFTAFGTLHFFVTPGLVEITITEHDG